MDKTHRPIPDVEVLPTHVPVPGMGFLPVNAFVLKAREPVLVDTGIGMDSDEFMKALESVIDPRDLRWIWLTHDDADHTGSIRQVLDAAPNARLVAHALATLRMNSAWPVPMDRVYWVKPGETLSVGDRDLVAVKPPVFDNPTALGFYDEKSDALFSVDCFGAILPSPVGDADDVAEDALAAGAVLWAAADSPWLHLVEPSRFERSLKEFRRINPKMVFSSHLPPARGKIERLLQLLATVPASDPFVPPNQAVLEQLLPLMKGEVAASAR